MATPSPSIQRATVGVALAAGLGLRVWVLASPLGRPDADEAVVGLMARRVLDGHVDVFFAGQNYGGTQEPMLLAAVSAPFGVSSGSLKLVAVLLAAGAGWVVWRIGLRTIGRRGAALAAALAWMYSGVAVWWSTKLRGFYGVGTVLGLLVLLTALRLDSEPSRRNAVLLGLVAGVGWWATPQTAYFSVPAAVWLLAGGRRVLRVAPVALAAAAVAAAPWLLYNVRHSFQSLDPGYANPFGDNLQVLYGNMISVVLGLRMPFDISCSPALASAALVAVLLAFCWLVLTRSASRPQALLVVGVLLFPVLFSLQPFHEYGVLQPHYVLFVWPFIALLVAGPLARTRAALPAVVALALVAALGIDWLDDHGNVRTDLAAPPIGPLLDAANDHHVEALFAPYHLAYRVTLVSGGDVAASPMVHVVRGGGLSSVTRFPDVYRQAVQAPRSAYAFGWRDVGRQRLLEELRRRRFEYEVVRARDHVLVLLDRRVPPFKVPGLTTFDAL